MLTLKQVALLRNELKTAQRPLFFYDDDPDGLTSFLLLYKVYREGRGVIVKSSSKLEKPMLGKDEEQKPDKIFVLDVPVIDQEFAAGVHVPIFWIDHHQPLQVKNVQYFNPRVKDPDIYIPTSRMAYQISTRHEDLWIAAVGCFGDYYLPDFLREFLERYPALLPKALPLPEILYQTPVGKLVRIFSFLLKGKTTEVYKCIKILTRIASPDEILQQSTPAGKYLFQRFEQINQRYEPLIERARQQATKSKVLLFHYQEDEWSFTADLANELAAAYQKKVIIIAREKGGEMKCSLRAQFPILPALEKALVGIDGFGGGHPNACGMVIKKPDWERFLQRFKDEVA